MQVRKYKIDIKPVSEALKAAEEAETEEIEMTEEAEEELVLDIPEEEQTASEE